MKQYALISGNNIIKGLTRFQAIRQKRWAAQMIVAYENESEIENIPVLEIKERKKDQQSKRLYPGEWDFGKLSQQQQFELLKAYQEQNYPVIESLIIKNKVMGKCGSCTYSQPEAMEWIKHALENGRL